MMDDQLVEYGSRFSDTESTAIQVRGRGHTAPQLTGIAKMCQDDRAGCIFTRFEE